MRSAERCTRRSLLDGSLYCPVWLGLLPKGTELSQRYTPARMGGYEFFCVELSYNIWDRCGQWIIRPQAEACGLLCV
ncbi:MAG: hypothetical protein JSY10_12725 [Paenibacillus sp.]|nr:hypothetical protein [Paenibacillus sp.]